MTLHLMTTPATRRRAGALLTVAAATLAIAPAAQAKTVTVTKSGKSITLRKGDKLVVRLTENPSTGYHWTTTAKPACLELASSRYVAPVSTSDMPLPGAPGTRVRTYLAKAKGGGTLKLASVGPTGVKGGAFTLKVTVR